MKEKIALVSVVVNIFLGIVKITAGMLSGSLSVLSEGIHSAVDVLSAAICLPGIIIAKKPVDEKHPYGYYKFEVFAGVIITIILAITGAFIIWQAYKAFFNPENLNISMLTLGVMLFSAIVNEVMARLKINAGKKENTISLVSEGVHSRVDVLSSVAVLVGLILVPYWPYADSIIAFMIGIYILKESFFLGKEVIGSLLDVSAGQNIEDKIKQVVGESITISEMKTQKKGSIITASLKIKLPNQMTVKDASVVANNLRKQLMREINSLAFVDIQIESHDFSASYHKSLFSFGKYFCWFRNGKTIASRNMPAAKGVGGDCLCPYCGFKTRHQRGIPCVSQKCPKCGKFMTRS